MLATLTIGLLTAASDAAAAAEFVFDPDDPPTPQCHASTIVETPTGLVAAWFGGTREKDPDVGIYLSRRTDSAWSRPARVFDGSEGGEEHTACWNPVLFRPDGGPLMLFYKVGRTPAEWHGMLATSTDDGRTWSEPRRLGSDERLEDPNAALIGPVKNKPVALPGGDLLAPSSSEHDGWRLHFERSADGGRTWDVVGPIESDLQAIQPSILFHPGGRLQAIARTRKARRLATTWSEDAGRSWAPPTLLDLSNPNAGTDAVTLRDGRHLLVFNPLSRGRQRLAVAVSADGVVWETVRTLEDGRPGDEFSYPAVIQTSDDTVHVTYTWQRRSIRHVAFPPPAD